MEFTYYNLQHLKEGQVVRVDIEGPECNVQLLDLPNFKNYSNGKRFNYQGGHYKTSPVILTVPFDGEWYLVIDLGTKKGEVNSKVQVFGL